jgi:hypothetical protein
MNYVCSSRKGPIRHHAAVQGIPNLNWTTQSNPSRKQLWQYSPQSLRLPFYLIDPHGINPAQTIHKAMNSKAPSKPSLSISIQNLEIETTMEILSNVGKLHCMNAHVSLTKGIQVPVSGIPKINYITTEMTGVS